MLRQNCDCLGRLKESLAAGDKVGRWEKAWEKRKTGIMRCRGRKYRKCSGREREKGKQGGKKEVEKLPGRQIKWAPDKVQVGFPPSSQVPSLLEHSVNQCLHST